MPTVDPLQSLLALGVLIAVVPTGLRLVGGHGTFSPQLTGSTALSIAIPAGVALWSVV
jgi:hypothetical protein